MSELGSVTHTTERIHRLELPEHQEKLGKSLRAAERELEQNTWKHTSLIDLTYADTRRFPAPDWAIKVFTEATQGGGSYTYTSYRGDRAVRETLHPHLSRFLGLEFDPGTELMLTPGTQGALYTALASLVQPGDKVAVMDPDYLTNHRMMRYFGAEVTTIPLLWRNKETISVDIDKLEETFQKGAKVFLFSNPNNPTGIIHGPETVKAIAQLAQKYNVFIIADELYSRLIYDNRPFLHIATLEGMKERTLTVLGPSKTESMSGYRLGVAVGPAFLIDRMEDVQSVAALRAPAYAQHLLKHWLSDDEALISARIQEYQALRDTGVDRLRQSGLVDVITPGGTSYMYPRITAFEASDQEVALRLQNDAGVIVNPGYQSGLGGTGHFRICFAQDEKVWDQALTGIIDTLKVMQKER
ncbi:aminotransferase class I/II-fold pyridoxal phosphate-dependent enzyme [Paenalcaligenes niemegkensis]|uniref:aminotransferase class I/II-fold pyridoxal phosphate-dependent enzyme n=1 Tax=Paenalcaligenes niemegkensis TaxID=2895469 RepID=UPI001EE9864E|nr:aminotransferase class I/II-fold pyridoxal phosphate-dependent enzyme [Paenalcaligenes niemegkensis]MCQ9617687.1 aminotransferase class I/II-fold pyridoxal phosphate-dependent enzyme [Paenalcaligenes niemegkensis]